MRKILSLTAVIMIILFLYSGLLMAEDSAEKITDIVIEGNEHVSENEILSVVKTKVGDDFNSEKIKEEVQAIYDLGYFQDIRVALQNYDDGIKIILRVIENPVLAEINISGNKIYSKEKITEWLGVKTGDIINMKELDKGFKNVREKYQDNGYVLAQITDVNIDEEGVLNLTINPGYINEVFIDGNEKTKDFVIERHLDFKKGQILNIEDIKEAYRDLFRLNYFEEVSPEYERVEGTENTVDLLFNLKETKTGSFNFGGGYSSADGWFGFMKVSERNLLGNGQTLGFDWEFGNINNYSLHFREPWLFGHPTSFGLSVYDETSSFEDEDEEDYSENRRGGSISLGHALTERWDGTVKYRIENYSKTMDITTSQNRNYDIRSLTFVADRDTTNYPLNPTEGARDALTVEYAGDFLGGDYDFTKYNIDVRRYLPGFKPEHSWALRFETGIGEGNIPASEQFSVGGAQSLRGYETYEFTGNDMLLMNLEYRFPIAEKFTGVVFADGGNTWNDIENMSLGELNHSLGVGVRLNLPIGQIRLDYGWNKDGEGMPHFSIGNTF